MRIFQVPFRPSCDLNSNVGYVIGSESLVSPRATAQTHRPCVSAHARVRLEVYPRKQKPFENFQCFVIIKRVGLSSWIKCRWRAGELTVLKWLLWPRKNISQSEQWTKFWRLSMGVYKHGVHILTVDSHHAGESRMQANIGNRDSITIGMKDE